MRAHLTWPSIDSYAVLRRTSRRGRAYNFTSRVPRKNSSDGETGSSAAAWNTARDWLTGRRLFSGVDDDLRTQVRQTGQAAQRGQRHAGRVGLRTCLGSATHFFYPGLLATRTRKIPI